MDADSFNRLAKALVDSGETATIEEALDAFSAYGVRVCLGANLQHDPAGQVIALTAINAASRSFEGNVALESADIELTVPGFQGQRLSEFLRWAKVKEKLPAASGQWPVVAVGDVGGAASAIRPWAAGWDFGVGPMRGNGTLFAPACVAAAGVAVSEAFSVLRRDNPYAGRRTVDLSLWKGPAPAPTPPETIGVAGLWLVGLGHLGQAYAWTLGFTKPTSQPLVLQDVDKVTKSTLSTSLVSVAASIGQKKSRVVLTWLESRGFNTTLVERRFDENQRLAAGEPTVALFGVDNPAARRVMEQCGFRLVVDAGLGSGFRDFRAMRLRTFPGPSTAAALWTEPAEAAAGQPDLAPAYRDLLGRGADPCGVTTLATRAVGAPFVGCVAAGLALAEVARREVGGSGITYLDLNLRDPARADVGLA
jgi:hypothetical protein